MVRYSLSMFAFLTLFFSMAYAETSTAQRALETADPSKKAVLSVTTLTAADAVHPGETLRVAVQVTMDSEALHVNAHKPRDEFSVPTQLTVAPPDGFSVSEPVYPASKTITLQSSTEPMDVYGGIFLIGLEVSVADSVEPGDHALSGTLAYQACDSRQCFPPEKASVTIPIKVVAKGTAVHPLNADAFANIVFEAPAPAAPVAELQKTAGDVPAAKKSEPPADWRPLAEKFSSTGSASGYLGPEEFLAFVDNAETGLDTSNPFARKSTWLVLLLVLGGGLLLNLTPCVLPLIPINLALIGAGAKAGSRGRGFALGTAYGLGIAAAYGALGIAVVLGVSRTFGAINATPWFNAGIAVLFVVLALAMFDLIVIDFTRYQSSLGAKRNSGSFVAAFVMGAVSAVLAGACVAPVIISTLVYAQAEYARGNLAALALPFLLGAGMGLPWPFAGAGLAFLPKPGMWMVRVKQAFGVLILGFAVYYSLLAFNLFKDRYAVDSSATVASTKALDAEGWQSALAPALKEAADSGKPVIVDFWATWCKNCMVMNATTLKDPRIVKRLDGYVKVKVQAEDVADPETRALMDHFGVMGLPTYVVLKSKPSS